MDVVSQPIQSFLNITARNPGGIAALLNLVGFVSISRVLDDSIRSRPPRNGNFVSYVLILRRDGQSIGPIIW
jgi:hypothetical protein